MTGEEFVAEMNVTLWQLLSVREAALAGFKDAVSRADLSRLLKGEMHSELEAAETAARWVPTTEELDVKLAFARQAGDEARHHTLLSSRLEELGVEVSRLPRSGRSKLFRFMEGLGSTVERVAAALYAREAVGCRSAELFIDFCKGTGDTGTAALYRRQILPDEQQHHEWGRLLLAALASREEAQAAARSAILTTLDLAEGLRQVRAGQPVVETLPGC